MATITHTCTGCIPIDSAILEVYIALVSTNREATLAEAARIVSENERISAESERERLFGIDHAAAVVDHAAAVADHGTAMADHSASEEATAAANSAAQSVGDATARANAAAAAAEHMVDIHQGPPGISPVVGGNGNWWTWDDATGQFVDTGEPARGEDGVGFQSVSSQQDGTIVITLTDGNTITIDLNHNHPQYPKYEYLEDESEMPATPDEDTLYLIAEESE